MLTEFVCCVYACGQLFLGGRKVNSVCQPFSAGVVVRRVRRPTIVAGGGWLLFFVVAASAAETLLLFAGVCRNNHFSG